MTWYMRIEEEEVEVDGGGAKRKGKRGLDGCGGRWFGEYVLRTQYSVPL